MHRKSMLLAISTTAFAVAAAFSIDPVSSQLRDGVRDPGVRVDPPGARPSAGGHIARLTDNEIRFFRLGKEEFEEVEERRRRLGTEDEPGRLRRLPFAAGDRRNEPGGESSGGIRQRRTPAPTPRSRRSSGANGPVREARFVRNPDGTPDGGVHALFTITGRPGAAPPGCRLAQPDFEREISEPQRDLPDSDPGIRRRPDRTDPGRGDPGESGRQLEPEEGPGNTRAGEFRASPAAPISGPGEQQRQ